MRVRRAREDEIDEILAMDRECFPLDDPPVDGARVLWWVAEAADDLVGYVGAYQSTWWPECLYMHRVGVLPAARGQGVSERLVRAVMRYTTYTGAVGLVTDTNTPAMANALYRCGWKMFETPPWSHAEAVYFRWSCGS